MPHSLDQIIPSLASLGILAYWLIGAAAAFEAWFLTGVFVPGTLVVDAGGILVQQGQIDFFDLVWFVVFGSVLGAEIGYWTGLAAKRGLSARTGLSNSRGFARAQELLARHGALALVIGRFLGPIAGLVPFAAALAGVERRRFVIGNIAGAVIFALVHVSLGYFLGDVFTRLSPAITRLAVLLGIFSLGLAILWWVVIRVERFLPFALSVGRTIARAIGEVPEVADWRARHPQLTVILKRRLDPSRFVGLTATALGLVFFYILTVWADSAFAFLTAEPILLVDERVALLVHSFWTPELLSVFTRITALGSAQVVVPLAVLAITWLWVRGRSGLAIGLATSVIGTVGSVALLKLIFDRPRPELAYFAESSNSFPSGHAAISVGFFTMLFYALWRSRRLGLISASLMASGLAFTIGFSRIFLIEHYLTDVMNGWLVGNLWVIVGIAVAEWRAEARPMASLPVPSVLMRRAALVLTLVLLPLSGWNVAHYRKDLNPQPAVAQSIPVAKLADMLQDPGWSSSTESVMGTPLEPVNVILLAKDAESLAKTMNAAGWLSARPPKPGPLIQAAWAAYTNGPDDTAPVTPYFWARKPNDLAFERPTSEATLRERHHVRIWQTPWVRADGMRIFFGAASFDDGLDPGIFHHIAPNIDAERDTLAADLVKAGGARLQPLAVSEPRLGQSVAGDPWFTDGAAAVMLLP